MRISLQEASRLLNSDNIAAVPTETVYGLAASLYSPAAIERIYTLKGRPSSNPLIVHISEMDQLLEYINDRTINYYSLAEAFWPGPMTIVVPVDPTRIPSAVRANLPTAAFRIPAHPLVRQLIALAGPLVMPSANISGRPSSTCAEHIEEDFGLDFPVLDGGFCERGLESTILSFDEDQWKIVRQGALTPVEFSSVLGYSPVVVAGSTSTPLCPGQMFRHYSPRAKLRLIEEVPPSLNGILIGFSDRDYPSGCRLISLGHLSMPNQIAGNLYAVLRQIDMERIEEVWVDMNFPREGILSTVAERLFRAGS